LRFLTRRHPRFARHTPPPRINAKTESHLRFVGQADGVCLAEVAGLSGKISGLNLLLQPSGAES
jgi:hypothetical protein